MTKNKIKNFFTYRMPLPNNNYKKTKNLILIAVLLLTVGFGVLGVGERAWGKQCVSIKTGTSYCIEERGGEYYIQHVQSGVAGYAAYENIKEKKISKEVFDILSGNQNAESFSKVYEESGEEVGNKNLGTEGSGTLKEPDEPGTLEDILGSMVAWVLYYIAVGIGWIFMLVAEVMLKIAVFNTFVGQPIVKQGWLIVRDICNNFFIIFLMILAVQVTLNIKANEWRSKLTNILIYAVLINFSLTIVGIAIDASQILMLTFASPIAGQMGNNIIFAALGLPQMLQMEGTINSFQESQGIRWIDLIAALLFAIIVSIVALVVVICITAILIWRIVMLIFLCILSPLPFLSRAGGFSVLKSLESEYVGKLTNMLVVGPAMMFFLYLSFLMMAASIDETTGDASSLIEGVNTSENLTQEQLGINQGAAGSTKAGVRLSSLATVEGLFKFMVVIGFLWGSLMMGKKFGDAASGIAGKGMGMISSGAKKFSGFNLAKRGASAAAGRAKEFAGDVTGYTALTGATNAYFAKQKAERAKARGNKITNLEGKISGGVSSFKSGLASPFKMTGQGAYKLWSKAIGGAKAEKIDEQIDKDKARLEEQREQLRSRSETLTEERNNQASLRGEAEDLTAVADRLDQYSGRANDDDFVVGDKRYLRQADGSYNQIDIDSGNVSKTGIAEENLQDEAIGYKDEFQRLVNRARQDQANGVTDANFEKDGYKYYLRNDGRGWNKVNMATGQEELEISDNDLRNNATGNRDLMQEIETKVLEKTKQAGDLDSGIRDSDREVSNLEADTQNLEQSISNNEQYSQRLKNRQQTWDKWGKRGLMAGAVAAGAVTGGALAPVAGFGAVGAASLLGSLGGYATGKGALGTADAIKNAGKADKKIFDNISHGQLIEAGKNLGDFDDDTILAKLDDTSLKKFDSMAYQLEAIRRGIVDGAKADQFRNKILSETALNGQNNKKIESLVDGALFKNKNYAELSKSYSQLNSDNAREQQKGREVWRDNINDRKYKLKDLSAEATDRLMDIFVEELDDFSSFKTQFEEAKKEGKANQVVNSLRNVRGANEARAKQYLARIAGVNEAYGNDTTGAVNFVKSLGHKELERMFEENDEKLQQVVQVVSGRSQNLSAAVQKYINSGKGQALRSALNIS